ncbi:DUF1761 domain-containing protein [Bacillus sp. FJAT-49732]|uniref:DUF1761 domain-containing protein n=1 Tax=Lederbergia citrisecunda TaxID=2833583 RepID=A0A942YLV6_9BACI|nr:DUF1761 domain-containing protein [Lederbergia citrisecunda]MBS4201062.1 DUF1761 domain-containing protein [Lederbergia citrisecunda]
MLIDWNGLNYIAIIIGGFLYMIYGAVYYSILLSSKKGNQDSGPIKYVVSVIIAFISSFFMATIIQASGSEGIVEGLTIGFMVGVIISLVYLKNTLFGLVNKKSFIIAIGDHLIIFTLLGGLHGIMV